MGKFFINLPPDWYEERKVSGVDPNLPGIFEWHIENVGVYIGQYTSSDRPYRDYDNNLRRLFNGLPYRKNKPDNFRLIHHALAEAVCERRRVVLTILENIQTKSERNRRRRELIAQRVSEQAQGGLPVLNSG